MESDSFRFLYCQIEKQIFNTFSDYRDICALIGLCVVAKQACKISYNCVHAVNAHLISKAIPHNAETWRTKYGPWAVVTGGSDGIGYAYACELAKRGLNIILISRNEEKLLRAKNVIESEYGVQVHYVVADFSSDQQSTLYKYIEEKMNKKDIGLLVNNVGVMYDHPDVFLNISSKKLDHLVSINMGAATRMTHMLLPAMVARGAGGVVTLSSSAAAMVTPGMTVYAATKRYLDYMMSGLRHEYAGSGVTFQLLVPFYVHTNMTAVTRSFFSLLGPLVPSAPCYAASAVATLGHADVTTGYLPHTLQLWMSSLVPEWLWMRVASRLNKYLKNQAKQKSI